MECFNGQVRDELLSGYLFSFVLEANVLIEDWRTEYNCERTADPQQKPSLVPT